MKHLENYGVQELNAREMKTTDGGGGRIMVCVGMYCWVHWRARKWNK